MWSISAPDSPPHITGTPMWALLCVPCGVDSEAFMKIGMRVEIPMHFDLWMRGARYGSITAVRAEYVSVKMDHPQVRKVVRIPKSDWDYMRIL